MRVVSGKVRGLTLKTIDSDSTRPTKDMVKEALFSIISGYTPDSIFLDLFAGSGAIGIEALSRGANKAYFCDNNHECIEVINENLAKAKFKEQAVVICSDFTEALESYKDIRFDIAYIDPPYNKNLGILSMNKISEYNLINENGIIILETDDIEHIPNEVGRYELINSKKYR